MKTHFKNILFHGLIGFTSSLLFSKYYIQDAKLQPKIIKDNKFTDIDNYLYLGFLP